MPLETLVMSDTNMFDILIIGAGPAGLTAAIYAAKSGRKTGYIEKSTPGGKLIFINEIHNLPGFDTNNGPEIAKRLFDQANEAGAHYLPGKVVDVATKKGYKAVFLDSGATYFCRALIVAIGIESDFSQINGVDQYMNKGVSSCVTCDGALTTNKTAIVIGHTAQTIKDALYLANIAKEVIIISKTDLTDYRSHLFQLNVNRKIKKYLQYDCVSVNGDGNKVKSVTIETLFTKERKDILADFIFINSDAPLEIPFLAQYPEIKIESNIIKTDPNKKTDVDGIYAIGDISRQDPRQIISAMNDAIAATHHANEYVQNNFK